MENIYNFDIFDEFFSLHPDVHVNEILQLSEASRYYQRLQGKTLNDICAIESYKKLCLVASELEIFRYKDYPVNTLRAMIIDKFQSVFSVKHSEASVPRITNEDEIIIQAPLLLGEPFEISVHDEIDLSECMQWFDIEFEEDKNGDFTIPTQSTIVDFMRPTICFDYKKMYRSLKWYKGRYYQYIGNKWDLIESLEDVTRDLFLIICNNTRTMNNEIAKMYNYIESHDKIKTRIRRILLKNTEMTVKTHSSVDVSISLQQENIPVAVEVETESVVAVSENDVTALIIYHEIMEELLNETAKECIILNAKRPCNIEYGRDNNMTLFFSK